MTFANNMDRDQAPQNVGPDLRSILFDTQQQVVLKTGCSAWNGLNFEDIKDFFNFTNRPIIFGGHFIMFCLTF